MYRFKILLLCVCLLWGTNAMAFGVNKSSKGFMLRQKQPSVTLSVNPAGAPTGTLEAVQAAMSTWNNVGTTSFKYNYGGTTTSTNCGDNDGVNIVCFNLDSSNRGSLAVNSVWYDPDTGEIFDDDINFNTKYLFSTDLTQSSYDLQSIATHELGHCLSLKDLYDTVDTEKTMYGYASKGETKKRDLEQDDMDGITFLYPRDSSYCTYSISPSTQTIKAEGGTGTITVTSQSGCVWMAQSSASWLTLKSGTTTGNGNGTVTYTAEVNTAPTSRTTTVTISNQTFTATQEGDTNAITPNITGNGLEGSLTIKTYETFVLRVSLKSGSKDGQLAQWWLFADTPLGMYYYLYPDQWIPVAHFFDLKPAYTGNLFNLQLTEVLNISGLPAGYYIFYFGVDTTNKGIIELTTLKYKKINLSVEKY
ncbi:MAG: matrixin family metalloprotease [Nitrospirae bacterium]|nr:matrixin family metalloprotease [Nitrospirota bacterium]